MTLQPDPASKEVPGPPCHHSRVELLNPFELVRKYRCSTCDGVMMCGCDRVFGERFLSHQLLEGTELETQTRVPVTHGFEDGICDECRGLPVIATPTSAIPGRTSKIKRFYWRELFFAETRRLAAWDDAHPDATAEERQAARAGIERDVLNEMKALHAARPKYDTREPSQAETLARFTVPIDAFHVTYAESPQKGAAVLMDGAVVSPEVYASGQYKAQGWSVMEMESCPLHALFGVMMWRLIQDPTDPKNRIVGFGSRTTFEAGEQGEPIHTPLPEDFGTAGYGRRRAAAIEEHLQFLRADGVVDRGKLLYLFDYWQPYSEDLRQYLWAHRAEDVDRARHLIEVLPPEKILTILRYLVDDYWERFTGWPDLLLYRGEEVMTVEVKSSSDRLSAEQMRWIAGNDAVLGLPFRLAKLHRLKS